VTNQQMNLMLSGLLVAGTIMILSACSLPNVRTSSEKIVNGANPKERMLGTVSFEAEDESDSSTVQVHKIQKGYALRSTLEREGQRETQLTVQRNKDLKWFAGLRVKWSF